MIFIVIPAYNEGRFIQSTITAIGNVLKKDKKKYLIILVDDGSSDNTVQLAKKFQKKYAIKIIQHAKNEGPGKAFLTGIIASCKKAEKKDILITIEADNTNDAELIPAFAETIQEGYDVVCASRFLAGGAYKNFPVGRLLFSKGANYILKLFFPISGISDYTIFFRAYKISQIKEALKLYDGKFIEFSGFVGNAEILIKLRALGIRATEIATIFDYTGRKGKSRMNVMKNLREYISFLYYNLKFHS